MAQPKIVVTTMLWRRFEIFKVWADALLDASDGNVEVLVAGSEGKASEDLVRSYGFHYIETPNAPIGRKANLRFAACKSLDPDYVILCGSDDIVSRPTFQRYLELIEEGKEEVCINDIYYVNAHTGEMAYSPGYMDHRKGEPIAPWRLLSRRVCETLQWRGWAEEERMYLDGHIYERLQKITHEEYRIHLRQEGLFVCDIKSQVNMTPWRLRPHWEQVSPSLLAEHLSPKIVESIEHLKGPMTNTKYLGVRYLES